MAQTAHLGPSVAAQSPEDGEVLRHPTPSDLPAAPSTHPSIHSSPHPPIPLRPLALALTTAAYSVAPHRLSWAGAGLAEPLLTQFLVAGASLARWPSNAGETGPADRRSTVFGKHEPPNPRKFLPDSPTSCTEPLPIGSRSVQPAGRFRT